MSPNPILKVLSTMRTHRVQSLLIGGQACVLYGGSEFSRDTDLAILCDPENIARLRMALDELEAELIAVPPLSIEPLRRGHAVHFRCRHREAEGMRVDIMSVMRNVAPFDVLWQRRSTVEIGDGQQIEVLSLPDLVAAKKTQRDKDWLHITRLIEASWVQRGTTVREEDILFWLLEARTPSIIRQAFALGKGVAEQAAGRRPLLSMLPGCSDKELAVAVQEEENREREADREYWLPLVAELQAIRHGRRTL